METKMMKEKVVERILMALHMDKKILEMAKKLLNM